MTRTRRHSYNIADRGLSPVNSLHEFTLCKSITCYKSKREKKTCTEMSWGLTIAYHSNYVKERIFDYAHEIKKQVYARVSFCYSAKSQSKQWFQWQNIILTMYWLKWPYVSRLWTLQHIIKRKWMEDNKAMSKTYWPIITVHPFTLAKDQWKYLCHTLSIGISCFGAMA